MQAYKQLLQRPFETIHIIVKRDGMLKELTLNTVSIR